jgi:hypothetical protein
MTITRTELGKQVMNVKCDNEQMKEITLLCVNDFESMFSFKQLCNAVLLKLDKEDLLQKKENVVYQGGFELSSDTTDKIQQFIWEQIWDKKLMIDLLNDEYRYSPDRTSARLIKLK